MTGLTLYDPTTAFAAVPSSQEKRPIRHTFYDIQLPRDFEHARDLYIYFLIVLIREN